LIRGERAREISADPPVGGVRYRTKVEVLRDILETTAPAASKTRILRLANLNPVSFDRYLAFCVGTGLLEPAGRKFRRTGSGDAAIDAIDGLMRKAEELGVAVRRLGACLKAEETTTAESTAALRFASLTAWDELVRRGARSGAWRLPRSAPSPGSPGTEPVGPLSPRGLSRPARAPTTSLAEARSPRAEPADDPLR
jgi:predicted transcriptional regulator